MYLMRMRREMKASDMRSSTRVETMLALASSRFFQRRICSWRQKPARRRGGLVGGEAMGD